MHMYFLTDSLGNVMKSLGSTWLVIGLLVSTPLSYVVRFSMMHFVSKDTPIIADELIKSLHISNDN